MTTSTLTVNSTLTASTITTTNHQFTMMMGSTITTSTLIINSTLSVSSIVNNIIDTDQLIFSSLMMQPSTFSTFVETPVSSILINMNGSWWKIPVVPA
jgi:hypothetical protein